MYVCICNGVSERQVHQAVAAGCSSLKELKNDLGVSNGCGRCAGHARNVLEDAMTASSLSQRSLVTYFQPAIVTA